MSIGRFLARWGAPFVLTAGVIAAAIFGVIHACGAAVPLGYVLVWSLIA
jgi:hypothetical protein